MVCNGAKTFLMILKFLWGKNMENMMINLISALVLLILGVIIMMVVIVSMYFLKKQKSEKHEPLSGDFKMSKFSDREQKHLMTILNMKTTAQREKAFEDFIKEQTK